MNLAALILCKVIRFEIGRSRPRIFIYHKDWCWELKMNQCFARCVVGRIRYSEPVLRVWPAPTATGNKEHLTGHPHSVLLTRCVGCSFVSFTCFDDIDCFWWRLERKLCDVWTFIPYLQYWIKNYIATNHCCQREASQTQLQLSPSQDLLFLSLCSCRQFWKCIQ